MSKVKIYVEGVNDQVFMANFMEIVLGFSVSGFVFQKETIRGEILSLGGWGNLRKPLNINDFKENTSDDIKNIVIIDVDSGINGGGFAVRQANIEATRLGFGLDFECFLLPNHREDGCLETVLRHILKEENKPILDCIDANDNCLREVQAAMSREISLSPLKDSEKAKINYFRRILKDQKSDFQDNTIWDLHHPYLNNLKQFLEQHLS